MGSLSSRTRSGFAVRCDWQSDSFSSSPDIEKAVAAGDPVPATKLNFHADFLRGKQPLFFARPAPFSRVCFWHFLPSLPSKIPASYAIISAINEEPFSCLCLQFQQTVYDFYEFATQMRTMLQNVLVTRRLIPRHKNIHILLCIYNTRLTVVFVILIWA